MATSTQRVQAFRARQAAKLEAAPDARLRSADDLLLPSVTETVSALELSGRDAGVARLALRYASVIDDAEDPAAALRVFGPLLAKVLAELRATPLSRKDTGLPSRRTPNMLDQLRAAHRATARGYEA